MVDEARKTKKQEKQISISKKMPFLQTKNWRQFLGSQNRPYITKKIKLHPERCIKPLSKKTPKNLFGSFLKEGEREGEETFLQKSFLPLAAFSLPYQISTSSSFRNTAAELSERQSQRLRSGSGTAAKKSSRRRLKWGQAAPGRMPKPFWRE